MPKKILTKSEEFFELIEQGWTIRAIADRYDHAVSTVRNHLKKHPKYTPPGSGNRTSRELSGDRRISKDYKPVNCPISPELKDRIDEISSQTNQTKNSVIRKALAEYCDRYFEAQTRKAKKSKQSSS